MKKNHRSALPSRLLFLDTETEGIKVSDKLTQHRMKIGYTCYLVRGKGKRKEWLETWQDWTSKRKILKYIESILVSKQPLYIIGSNVLFDLLAIGFIKYFTNKHWILKFCYSGGMSFILICRNKTHCIKCLSTQNFAPISVEKMGKVVGKEKLEVDFEKSSDEEIKVYCKRDTEIIRDFVMEYINYVKVNDMGKFSYTRAAQAMSLFRHRFMMNKIYIHNNETASQLESNAYFGGRTECFKLGDFTGKDITYIDVNSMYPFIMQRDYFPVKLEGMTNNPSAKWFKENFNKYLFIAEVSLDTSEACYVLRERDTLIYPIGKFDTFVCTYGLKYAIEHGHLKGIKRLAYYSKARIFKPFIKEMYALKVQHKKEGLEVWSEMDKYIMNSLYGKFGQRRDNVLSDDYTSKNDFNRKSYFNHDRQKWEICQTLFHRKQVFSGKEATNNTFYAIPAHVTEGSRFYMWSLIKRIGRQNVYYMDTDSLMIPSNKLNRYKDVLNNYRLGAVSVRDRSNAIKIHGCKDYEVGEVIKRKGIRLNAKPIGTNTFIQDHFPSLHRVMREGITEGFPIFKMQKTLKRIYTKGIPVKGGSVLPFQLPDQRPIFEQFVRSARTVSTPDP